MFIVRCNHFGSVFAIKKSLQASKTLFVYPLVWYTRLRLPVSQKFAFEGVLLPPGRSLRVDFFLFPTRSNTMSTKFDLIFEVLQFFYEEKERSKFTQTGSRTRSDETILTNIPPCCELPEIRKFKLLIMDRNINQYRVTQTYK